MAIGDTVQAGLLRVDPSAILRAGEAQASMGNAIAGLGRDIGGMIKQYGLNKEKRNKLESTLQGQLSADPSIVQQLTMSGDETSDKKNMKLFEDIKSGDASIAQLERANGLLAGRTMQENAMLRKRVNELDFSVKEALKDPTIRKAVGEANRAEAIGNYANSIASAEYAEKIADADLTRAQTEYYDAKSKAEQDSKSYTPGQRVDVEGISGNKVSFVWTGNSLQPLNDSVSKKSIQEAIIRGVDPALCKFTLRTIMTTMKILSHIPLRAKAIWSVTVADKRSVMEQAITILGMRPKVKDDTSPTVPNQKNSVKETPTITTQEEFDALPSGAIFIENGLSIKNHDE